MGLHSLASPVSVGYFYLFRFMGNLSSASLKTDKGRRCLLRIMVGMFAIRMPVSKSKAPEPDFTRVPSPILSFRPRNGRSCLRLFMADFREEHVRFRLPCPFSYFIAFEKEFKNTSGSRLIRFV